MPSPHPRFYGGTAADGYPAHSHRTTDKTPHLIPWTPEGCVYVRGYKCRRENLALARLLGTGVPCLFELPSFMAHLSMDQP